MRRHARRVSAGSVAAVAVALTLTACSSSSSGGSTSPTPSQSSSPSPSPTSSGHRPAHKATTADYGLLVKRHSRALRHEIKQLSSCATVTPACTKTAKAERKHLAHLLAVLAKAPTSAKVGTPPPEIQPLVVDTQTDGKRVLDAADRFAKSNLFADLLDQKTSSQQLNNDLLAWNTYAKR
ncbi:MAG TPA: hypothetical protein VG708_10890 [Mycobacteriales bacterium]|nr:hypothetical protein [Mycobacteriales bacterium]